MVSLRAAMTRPSQHGCCTLLHLREDNARFILLFVVLLLYMFAGAFLFMSLEQENEQKEKQDFQNYLEEFYSRNPDVNKTELEGLLKRYGAAETAGYVGNKRPRWDFSGSFYFVGTVISTIGFGMTTPRTVPGKIVLIFYGFFGCASAILFFNLFLERIITFLAYILRAVHEREMRRKSGGNGSRDSRDRRSSQTSDDDHLDTWKPSVYWVMLILLLGAIIVACCASAMYHPVENWTYFDAIYFCFVTFATIGFGDLVVSQKADYDYVQLYRIGNFIFIVIGCCCIYSLFNVTSIVIKQFLNWLIQKMNCRCRRRPKKSTGRRNAITPGHLQRHSKSNGSTKAHSVTVEPDSDSEGRRNSDEMISMRDFLNANKISLAMMQKQLWETSQRGGGGGGVSNGGGFQGPVGPLAILDRKLGQEEV